MISIKREVCSWKKFFCGKPAKGVAVIEFALLAPVLVALLLLTTEFGIALYDQSVITNAAREGARAGVLKKKEPPSSTLGDVRSVVENYTDERLISLGQEEPAARINVEIFQEMILGQEPALRVRVSYPYRGLMLLGGLEPFTLTSEAVMRYE
jgi:hypothetical protein